MPESAAAGQVIIYPCRCPGVGFTALARLFSPFAGAWWYPCPRDGLQAPAGVCQRSPGALPARVNLKIRHWGKIARVASASGPVNQKADRGNFLALCERIRSGLQKHKDWNGPMAWQTRQIRNYEVIGKLSA